MLPSFTLKIPSLKLKPKIPTEASQMAKSEYKHNDITMPDPAAAPILAPATSKPQSTVRSSSNQPAPKFLSLRRSMKSSLLSLQPYEPYYSSKPKKNESSNPISISAPSEYDLLAQSSNVTP